MEKMKPTQPTKQPAQTDDPLKLGMSGDEFVALLDGRINGSQDHWNKKYKLDSVTKKNEKRYYGDRGENAEGEDDSDHSPNNRIFSSVRTIVPYVTSRITEPMVFPSSKSAAAKRFAEDFEKAIYIHAENEKVKAKSKFALEDAIIRRRGYLKPRYDPLTKNFCSIEYVPAESIIIDHKAKPYEEPRYYRHVLDDKTVEDLITMFPDMKAKILEVFGLTENSTKAELQKEANINEDWAFVPDEQEGLDLIVCWNYKQMYLGGARDPNWRYGQENFLPHHMMPLVFFNVLSDGRSFIDKTSFVEQADTPQQTVDERTDQIGKNAGLGNIGMPVVDSAALADDQSQYLTFEPDTVLELDVSGAGKTSIRDVFDVWKAGTLSPDVWKDKTDAVQAVDDAFGVNSITRGNESNNKTAAQDVLLRDQSFGRQQEIVDAIDNAMSRLYPFIAQFLLVYGGQPSEEDESEYEMFEFTGEDSEFDYIMLNTQELDTKVKIRIKSGTSMPIDRPQRRATADKAAERNMIDPLSYWEIMDEGNAQKYAKRLMDYQADPPSFLKDTQEEVFNRDAFVDIEMIKQSAQPKFREDLPKEYFDYLNHYILNGNLDNPELASVAPAISQFIDAQLARGQKMLGMAETQLPTPEDVTAANEQTDQLNQQDQQAQKAQQSQQAPQGQPVQGLDKQPVAA